MRKIFSNNNEPPIAKTPLVQIGEHKTKGERSTMEDTSLIKHDGESTDFIVAIFDGHNGSGCSKFLRDSLLEEFYKQMKFHNNDIELSLKEAYHRIDQKWINYAQTKDCNDGSTGLCIIVNNNRIIVANTGDCRALMNRSGKCIELSRDHRPTDPEEMKRIEDNGGKVIGGRLQGELAVSRAFGDYRYKILESSLLTCDPEIREFPLTADVEFIVVACDGLYETFSNTEVIEYINRLLSESKEISEIAKALAEEAIDRGSGDNITIIIIKFEKRCRKILNTTAYRSAKKKHLNEDNLSCIKRKSLETPLKPSEKESSKKRKPGTSVNYDDEESVSLNEEDIPPSLITSANCLNECPTVTFTLKEFAEAELKIKKLGPMKSKNKKFKSKEYLSNFRLKKCKSKEDIPDDKKQKIGQRRRSKSTEDPNSNIRNTLLEKRTRKKGDYSSDEYEKENMKSKKKKRRNSLNFKAINEPTGSSLRCTMDESFLSFKSPKTTSKNSLKQDILLMNKTTSKQQPQQILSDQILLTPKYTKSPDQVLLGNHLVKNNKTSTSESNKNTKSILLMSDHHKHKLPVSDSLGGIKSSRTFSTDNGLPSSLRTDQFPNPKNSYVYKKH